MLMPVKPNIKTSDVADIQQVVVRPSVLLLDNRLVYRCVYMHLRNRIFPKPWKLSCIKVKGIKADSHR